MTPSRPQAIRPGWGGAHRAPARVRLRLLGVALLGVLAVGMSQASAAVAEPLAVTITSPKNGSTLKHQKVTFSGVTNDVELEPSGYFDPVTLTIYAGAPLEANKIKELETATPGHTWTIGPTTLAPGTYTAVAEESREPSFGVFETGTSSVTFTINTTPPAVTIDTPASGSSSTNTSQVIAGAAGTASHDLAEITVQLYAGPNIGSQAPLEGLSVEASGGRWSATFGGLSPGTYTAQAEQQDDAGNLGTSAPVTFTVTTPPPPPAPTAPLASFKWFPAAPQVGEHVSLISNSTDDTSPITAYAWSLGSSGPLTPGTQVLSTSFTTPGDHVVRLRVTAADGLSSVASETIHVSPTALTLMAPFPIVRIAGNVTSSGVSLSLLTVQAPVGARVKVSCHGGGCPSAPESRLAVSRGKKARATTVMITFRRFQRSLAAGAVLEIRIFKKGLIGKYTRFVIRRGRLPIRVDTCLGQAGLKPMPCPTS
jgi:PKD domain